MLSETLTPPNNYQPVFAAAGDFNGKNIAFTGNVQTGGNYSCSGSGSLTGDLIYAGSLSNANTVSGTITQAPFTPIDLPALSATLQSDATLSYAGDQTNKIFDFTAIPGTNKVIYVNGNVTNPTFIGTGTLSVKGTISADGFGTAASPVNLVASGSITTGNNITIYGAIYTGGDWNRGKVNLTGFAYVTGISDSNGGQSTMTQAPAARGLIPGYLPGAVRR